MKIAFLFVFLSLTFLGSSAAQVVGAGSGVRSNAISAQLYRAEIAYKSGASLLEAKVRVDRVLKQLPNDAEALKLRSRVFVAMGRYKEALSDARKAAAVDPNDGDSQLLVAITALQLGNNELAVRSMDKAAGLLVDNAFAHVELSRLARQMMQLEKAEAFARIAVQLQPNQSSCQIELARAFVAQGKTNAAKLVLQKAVGNGIISGQLIRADSLLAPMHSEFR